MPAFDKKLNDKFNEQIANELQASYEYTALAAHFDRHDVALPGFASFFRHSAEEEREHAQELINYVNLRLGVVDFQRDLIKPAVKLPDPPAPGALEAMEYALKLEEKVYSQLIDLHKTAEGASDPQATDFIEGEFLKEQVESIKKISNYITQIKRVGNHEGLYIFDKDLKS